MAVVICTEDELLPFGYCSGSGHIEVSSPERKTEGKKKEERERERRECLTEGEGVLCRH